MDKFHIRALVATVGSAALGALFPITEAVAQSSTLTINGCASFTVSQAVGATNVTLTCATATQTFSLGTCTLGPTGITAHTTADLFTMTCTNGTPSAVNWVVSPGSAVVNTYTSRTTANSQSIGFSAGATLYAIAEDATGATSPQVAVAIAAPAGTTPPPGTGGAAGDCTNFAKTLKGEFDTSNIGVGPQPYDTAKSGAIGKNGAFVGTFVTPNFAPTETATLSLTVSRLNGDGDSRRVMVISKNYCDFTFKTNWAVVVRTLGSSGTVSFALGSNKDQNLSLEPNTRYYVNVANTYGGVPACTYNSCDFRVQIGMSRD